MKTIELKETMNALQEKEIMKNTENNEGTNKSETLLSKDAASIPTDIQKPVDTDNSIKKSSQQSIYASPPKFPITELLLLLLIIILRLVPPLIKVVCCILFIVIYPIYIVTENILKQENYCTFKKAALIFSYLIAHAAVYLLLLGIFQYHMTALVLAALIAIAYQLYHRENTPSHFRQFCFNMSFIFLFLKTNFIISLTLLFSSWYAYLFYSSHILYVILNYDYLVANSSTGVYLDTKVPSNIAISIINLNAAQVVFFLGLISHNPEFPDALKNINWYNLILGIIIGSIGIWAYAMLMGLAAGNVFAACVGAIPNALSIIAVLITTPFQAYYEEYLFRHKLTEKTQSIYKFCANKLNTYMPEEYKINNKLEKNAYLVYCITSVFFALIHIASPGRNFSAMYTLATILPMGILFHKIYVDYGIEASAGVHAGNNILIWLNMLPVFIEVAATLTPANILLVIMISVFAQGIILLAMSKAVLKPITASEGEKPVKATMFNKNTHSRMESCYREFVKNVDKYINSISKSFC